MQEQWKSSTSASKRRDRADIDDGEGGHGEKRRRKGGKRRKKEKSSRSRYEMEDPDMMDDHDEPEDDDANVNFREPGYQMNDQEDNAEENAQDVLAAAGLEDSDADDDAVRTCLFLSCYSNKVTVFFMLKLRYITCYLKRSDCGAIQYSLLLISVCSSL